MTSVLILPSDSPATPNAELPPLPLYVRERGHGQPLVLIHGLASSSRYWEPSMSVLTQTYRAIMPDLLGFGRSPRWHGHYHTAEHVAALRAAILPRLDAPAIIVGHSMGSLLALHLAAAIPEYVAGMVLVSLPWVGNCVWGHEQEGMQARLHHFTAHTPTGQRLIRSGQSLIRPLWPYVYPKLRPDIPRGAAADAMLTDWRAYWESLEDVVYGSNVPALFAAARPPLTVIHGARDRVVPVSPVRNLVHTRPDVPYIEIPDAGHNPPFSHPKVLYQALNITV